MLKNISKVVNYLTAPVKVVVDKSTEYYHKYFVSDEEKVEVERMYPIHSYWTQFVVFFKSPTHIVDNIYLGSAFNAASYYKLQKLKIGMVMNVTREISKYYPSDFVYRQYDLYDNNKETIQNYLDAAIDDIRDFQENAPGSNILIHCFMGASRSASIVIYYLMKTKYREDGEPFTFEDAVEFVRSRREIINPTKLFQNDLNESCLDEEGMTVLDLHQTAEIIPDLPESKALEERDAYEILSLTPEPEKEIEITEKPLTQRIETTMMIEEYNQVEPELVQIEETDKEKIVPVKKEPESEQERQVSSPDQEDSSLNDSEEGW